MLTITCAIGLMLAGASAVSAQTWVAGPISEDTVWTLAGSPYVVYQNVRVNEHVTLTIEPGVRVQFKQETDQALDEKFNLTVSGQLIARGTAASPVRFTSHNANPEAGDWEYIRFTESAVGATYSEFGEYLGGSIFEHVIIEYGGGSSDTSTVSTNGRAPYFNHVRMQHNSRRAIYYWNVARAFIANSTFSDNSAAGYSSPGGAIRLSASNAAASLTINNSSFTNNSAGSSGGAIYSYSDYSSSVALTVSNSTFSNNTAGGSGGAIYVYSTVTAYSTVTVTDSTFQDNTTGDSGGAVYAYYSPVTLNSTDFFNNTAGYHGGAIYQYYAALTVNTGSFRNNSGYYGGAVYAYYASVTLNDSTLIDNAAGNRGSGGGIYFTASSTKLTANRTVLRGNSTGVHGSAIYAEATSEFNDTLIYQNYGPSALAVFSSTISRCTIANNYEATGATDGVIDGVFIATTRAATVAILDSNIFGHNRYEIRNNSPSDVDARLNYWGTADEMTINLKIFDEFDDSSKGEVIYKPFLTSLAPYAPEFPRTVELQQPHTAGVTLNSGDRITLEWITTGIQPSEAMVLAMKRDAVPESVTLPDNLNWYRFTEHGADNANDGAETVTLPYGLTEADDWRFYVRHQVSGIYDAARVTFRYVNKHAVSVSTHPAAGGSVSGAGTFTTGSRITLTATAAAGYVFSHWSEGNQITACGAGTAYTFDVREARSLTAHFSPINNQYLISATVHPASGGHISGAGVHNRNSSVTLIAHPRSGFNFVNWTETWSGLEGSCVVSQQARYAFTATRNRTLRAVVYPAFLPGIIMQLLDE